MTVNTINPAIGGALIGYEETPPDEVSAISDRAHDLGGIWRNVPTAERARAVRTLAATLRAPPEDLNSPPAATRHYL